MFYAFGVPDVQIVFLVLSPLVLTVSATKATMYIFAGSVANLPIFSGSLYVYSFENLPCATPRASPQASFDKTARRTVIQR